MIRNSRVVVLCLGLSIVLTAPGAAQEPKLPCGELPANIHVAPILQPAVIGLLRQSETFRRQCLAIAAARLVRVTIRAVAPRARGSSPRAHATLTRHQYGMVRAVLDIPIGSDYAELVPHEFEHVIEMIEGVDLAERAAAGDDGVLEVARGAFETTRARNAGLAASREVYGETDAGVRRTTRQIRRVWRAIRARAVSEPARGAGPASRR